MTVGLKPDVTVGPLVDATDSSTTVTAVESVTDTAVESVTVTTVESVMDTPVASNPGAFALVLRDAMCVSAVKIRGAVGQSFALGSRPEGLCFEAQCVAGYIGERCDGRIDATVVLRGTDGAVEGCTVRISTTIALCTGTAPVRVERAVKSLDMLDCSNFACFSIRGASVNPVAGYRKI